MNEWMSDPRNTSAQVPPGWNEILEESDADLLAGRVVPLSVVEAELRATIVEIEAELAHEQHPVAPKR